MALGLLLCLCYCLLGWFRDAPPNSIHAFQPVVVTNRNSPLVISAQTDSRTNAGAVGISGSVNTTQPKRGGKTSQRASSGPKTQTQKAKTEPMAKKSGQQITGQVTNHPIQGNTLQSQTKTQNIEVKRVTSGQIEKSDTQKVKTQSSIDMKSAGTTAQEVKSAEDQPTVD